MAEMLVSLAPETLRYISVCVYDSFVTHGNEIGDSRSARRIVTWRSAVDGLDEDIRRQVREWACEDDLQFIDPTHPRH